MKVVYNDSENTAILEEKQNFKKVINTEGERVITKENENPELTTNKRKTFPKPKGATLADIEEMKAKSNSLENINNFNNQDHTQSIEKDEIKNITQSVRSSLYDKKAGYISQDEFDKDINDCMESEGAQISEKKGSSVNDYRDKESNSISFYNLMRKKNKGQLDRNVVQEEEHVSRVNIDNDIKIILDEEENKK